MPRAHQAPLESRFFSNIYHCPHGPMCPYCCWEWQAMRNHGGYGMFARFLEGKWRPYRAHRFMWEWLNRQTLPPRRLVLHHCDNPPCCNPWHLYPGTHAINGRDASKRGLLAHRRRARVRYGQELTQAKLTEKDIPRIWDMHHAYIPAPVIAQAFHVSTGTIHAVLDGRTWQAVSATCPHPDKRKGQVHGDHHPHAKLTEADIPIIWAMARTGATKAAIARHFHVRGPAIANVLCYKTWAHISRSLNAAPVTSAQCANLTLDLFH
jgi:hypothetical protein